MLKRVLLLLLLPVSVHAQEALSHFTCVDLSPFGAACAPIEVPPATASVAVPRGAPYPLFAPQTLARDTPPVFVDLLNAPTPKAAVELADQYIEWHERRLQRVQEVNALLHERTQRRRGDQ